MKCHCQLAAGAATGEIDDARARPAVIRVEAGNAARASDGAVNAVERHLLADIAGDGAADQRYRRVGEHVWRTHRASTRIHDSGSLVDRDGRRGEPARVACEVVDLVDAAVEELVLP